MSAGSSTLKPLRNSLHDLLPLRADHAVVDDEEYHRCLDHLDVFAKRPCLNPLCDPLPPALLGTFLAHDVSILFILFRNIFPLLCKKGYHFFY